MAGFKINSPKRKKAARQPKANKPAFIPLSAKFKGKKHILRARTAARVALSNLRIQDIALQEKVIAQATKLANLSRSAKTATGAQKRFKTEIRTVLGNQRGRQFIGEFNLILHNLTELDNGV